MWHLLRPHQKQSYLFMFHNVVTWQPVADLGTNSQLSSPNLAGRAGHTVVQTQDGAFWIWGGQDTDGGLTTWADGYTYVR